jgi:hypothetical protein
MVTVRLVLLSILSLVATGCCCGGFGSQSCGYGGGGCSSGACGVGPAAYGAPIGATAMHGGVSTAGVIGNPVIGAPQTATLAPIESLPPY